MNSETWPDHSTPAEVEEELRNLERIMCPVNTPLQSYLGDLQSSGQPQCTTVWTKGIVAYRCRTCQVNDSSAICVGCFLKGNHKTHDYVMYHSESGGCCDCGDPDAWQISGFCAAHRSVQRQEPCVSPHLVEATKDSVGWVLYQLSLVVICIGEARNGAPITKQNKEAMASIFLDWLQKVCAVDALRNIVCLEVVRMKVKTLFFRETSEMKSPLQILLRTFSNMSEDIMEGETTLYLQMLYNPTFKHQFSEELVKHYQFMIESVVDKIVKHRHFVKDFRALDSSLDRVMVQLFNVPNMDLIKRENLLKLFVDVFGGILRSCVKKDSKIVNVGDVRIENKVYLRPQGDLRLIVAHAPVAQYLLEERTDVFKSILDVLALLQWMNPYSLKKYVDFEDDNAWTLAIQLEMNTMAIVFQLVARCYSLYIPESEESAKVSRSTLLSAARCTLARLREYLAQKSTLDLLRNRSLDIPVSLHIPLHRTLSAILAKLVLLPWIDEKEGFLSNLLFDYSEDEVLSLMEHPLRITVWMAQIRANQWYENSDDFSRLELIYRGSFWHDQSMDMDILLLQFCVVAREDMGRAIFMRMAERFELKELVSSPWIDHDRIAEVKISLLQDFMRLILLVVRERRNTGMKEEDCLRYDVIQWLCVRDQTYSQLCRALSAIPVDHLKLTDMLEKVAHFHNPKVQERGFYQLKAECWEEFDPLFAHFYLNELEDAQERATNVGKLQHYWRIRLPAGLKPPFNRLINLLHTQVCHQLLWNVLFYVSRLVTNESTATAGEALGVLALQMMGLALQDLGSKGEKDPFSAGAWQHPTASCNDIFLNVHSKPYLNQKSGLMEWGSHTSEFPSILDLLKRLQALKNSPRLVDSVDYVLHLFPATPFNSTSGAEQLDSQSSVSLKARIITVEDDQRMLKKQRQEAIMAQFKAKQKAFWDQYDISDDEGSGTHSGRNAEAGSSVTSSSTNSPNALAKNKKVVSEAIEVHECVFCRTKCGGNDTPTGWIALVQRYNMPNVVMLKGTEVSDIENAESIAKGTGAREADTTSSDADGNQLVICMGKDNTIDHVPTEHVRCCGHQMHLACFQTYHATLVKSHISQTTYEGRSIIDLQKTEFLCPICRRLANALLPVVYQESLLRMLQVSENEYMPVQREKWLRFWNIRNNLPEAIDHFALQSLRVRSNFYKEEEVKDLPKCPVLWEVLAGNIIHCEVETREEVKEVASSSATPTHFNDQRTWGGDSGHWIAIQELGKLAMLSNTIEIAQEMDIKRKKIETMKKKVEQILNNGDSSIQNQDFRTTFGLLSDALVRQQDLLEEVFELKQYKDDALMSEVLSQEPGRTRPLGRPTVHVSGNNPAMPGPMELNEMTQDVQLWPGGMAPPMPQYHLARGMPNYDPAASDEESVNKRRGRPVGVRNPHPMSPEDFSHCSQPESSDCRMEWSSSILDSSLFEADPFWLLIVLLSAYPGWPRLKDIMLLVKFSYTVAATQILLACSSLQRVNYMGVLSLEREWGAVMNHTCLPFLRRTALLMQVITGEDFKGTYMGSGRKVMDATYLQQELGLIDSFRIFTENQGGGDTIFSVEPSSISQQLELYHKLTDAKLMIKKVPRQLLLAPLPSVFQELLLRSIQEPCKKCKTVPGDPAVCLVCGVFFCSGNTCCTENNIGECSNHAEAGYAGIGIFLLMRSTQLVLIRGDRVCMAPSLYLDQHGEDAFGERQEELDSPDGPEDTFLRRSQLLHLSELRLNEVRRMWLTAGFDYDTHILHNSQISSRVL